MKKLFPLFLISFLLVAVSCQTRVVPVGAEVKDNTLELYQKYTIQTTDAKVLKMQVLKVDNDYIYGKNKNGEDVKIERKEVREVKKFNLVSSIAIGAAAVLALILIPV